MSRLAAFSLFVSAAFGWPLWFVDRTGLALLGFGFMALAVGAGRARARGAFAPRATPWASLAVPDVPPVLRDVTAGEVDDSG